MSLTNDAFVDALNYWQDRAKMAEKDLKLCQLRQDRAADREHRLSEILKEVYAELEDNFDVMDGEDSQPRPNRWMSIGTNLAFECRKLGIDVTNR